MVLGLSYGLGLYYYIKKREREREMYFLAVSTFVTMKFMNPADSKQQIQYGLV